MNDFIVGCLMALSAVEALPEIERAFERGYVRGGLCGDFDTVRRFITMTPEERNASCELDEKE